MALIFGVLSLFACMGVGSVLGLVCGIISLKVDQGRGRKLGLVGALLSGLTLLISLVSVIPWAASFFL
jgi:hypothetical protein